MAKSIKGTADEVRGRSEVGNLGFQVLMLGNRRLMPPAFPLQLRENAGNMVHADAAFRIVRRAAFHTDDYPVAPQTTRFVEERCSHIVYVFANALRLGEDNPHKFQRTVDFLKATSKPIVVFGLGAQADSYDQYDAALPAAAIEMLKRVADRCTSIGVRGAFTERVLKHHGISNVRVTGCPSLYTALNPKLQIAPPAPKPGYGIAFSGTHYHQEDEAALLGFAVRKGFLHVEPVNALFYEANRRANAKSSDSQVKLPYFLEGLVRQKEAGRRAAERYVRDHFHLFWDMETWKKFNRERVWFTYGTRFHVNMASLVSGVPALWVTHDSRTRELADFMCLPHAPIEEVREISYPMDLVRRADYTKLNTRFPELYENFRSYLNENGLDHNL